MQKKNYKYRNYINIRKKCALIWAVFNRIKLKIVGTRQIEDKSKKKKTDDLVTFIQGG